MTFRTPDEAIALANNTRYGLAASVWTENVNRALEVAARVKAGVVWINSTNLFDAAAGFGGYRESGFGREGGREGLAEYLVADGAQGQGEGASPAGADRTARPEPRRRAPTRSTAPPSSTSAASRRARIRATATPCSTPKAPRSVSPAWATARTSATPSRRASKASGWGAATAHNRAQVLYYVAENLEARAGEFAERLRAMTGASQRQAREEVEAAVRRTFYYAGFADKYDGAVHATKTRFVTLGDERAVGA